MQAIPMTLRGAEKLREELDFLKSVRRPEIIAAITEAREHGDLKENAEYHAAREQQGFCEGRIKDIEAKLSNAQVIDTTVYFLCGSLFTMSMTREIVSPFAIDVPPNLRHQNAQQWARYFWCYRNGAESGF